MPGIEINIAKWRHLSHQTFGHHDDAEKKWTNLVKSSEYYDALVYNNKRFESSSEKTEMLSECFKT